MSRWVWHTHLQPGCCSSIAGGAGSFAYCERSFGLLIRAASFSFLSIFGCIWETFHLHSIGRHLGPKFTILHQGRNATRISISITFFQALRCNYRLALTEYIYICNVCSTLNIVILSLVNLSPDEGFEVLPVNRDLSWYFGWRAFSILNNLSVAPHLDSLCQLSPEILLRFEEREHMFRSLICNELST